MSLVTLKESPDLSEPQFLICIMERIAPTLKVIRNNTFQGLGAQQVKPSLLVLKINIDPMILKGKK